MADSVEIALYALNFLSSFKRLSLRFVSSQDNAIILLYIYLL